MEFPQPKRESPQASTPDRRSGLQSIRDRVRKVFGRDRVRLEKEQLVRKEDLPPMQIDFFLSAHESAQDADLGTKDLASYDIYMMENAGWTPETLEAIRDTLSHSNPSYRQSPLLTENSKREFDILREAKIPVGTWDVPADSKEYDEVMNGERNIKQNQTDLDTALSHGDFQSALKNQKKMTENLAALIAGRDPYALKHFPERVAEVLEAYPALQDKPELRILVKMGSAHAHLVNQFKNSGYTVTREYPYLPYYFSPAIEAEMQHGMGKRVSDRVLTQAVFERFLGKYSRVFQVKEGQQLEDEFRKRVLQSFSVDEMRSIIKSVKGQNSDQIRLMLGGILIEKGIPAPQTVPELETSLQDLRGKSGRVPVKV